MIDGDEEGLVQEKGGEMNGAGASSGAKDCDDGSEDTDMGLQDVLHLQKRQFEMLCECIQMKQVHDCHIFICII